MNLLNGLAITDTGTVCTEGLSTEVLSTQGPIIEGPSLKSSTEGPLKVRTNLLNLVTLNRDHPTRS